VPLRVFDLLWSRRRYDEPIEIEVQSSHGWSVAMELLPDSTEQILVRPRKDLDTGTARSASLRTVFVPPMTGLATEEPLYANREFLDLRLSQARPGEVLRNILHEAGQDAQAWDALRISIKRLFGYEILPPDARGAHILAEYRIDDGPRLDIASAGSGFQQVLMLLAYLNTRPGSVLLLDEPDAHLHVILQDAIYSELRAVAASKGSQLVVSTHSEVVINSVDPDELCVVLHEPRMLADTAERQRLIKSLGILSNTDVMLAIEVPGVLYVEDYTDLDILRAWATTLGHKALPLLTTRLLWRKTVSEPREGASGVSSRDHYEALRLVRADLPGLEILDRDGNERLPETEIVGQGLQRVRWKRYEIESYLVHPLALERFVSIQMGGEERSREARQDLRTAFTQLFSGLTLDFERDPLHPPPLVETFLTSRKARTDVLPPLLSAAGLPGFPYTRYHEIAAAMAADEIHPEAIEKLDMIATAFNR
jgi:hypothetical protein